MSNKKLPIIPYPKKLVLNEGCGTVVASVSDKDGEFESCVKTFTELTEKIHGISLSSGDGITLNRDNALAEEEYRISVNSDGVKIFGSHPVGISHALSTIIQACDVVEGGISLPKMEIEDKPDCNYRAVMVDLGRQWHPFPSLICYVDLCYLYKIRFLHLHFIDSNIYSLPSKAFPKMPSEGMHYSFEEIKMLNDYALSRGVEIIPEMEVPGHAKQIVVAYPELFADIPDSDDEIIDYALFFANIKKNLICAGKPGVIDTVCKLAKEIIDMFPNSRYLHIGGDEAAIGEWANCRDCKRYMKENNIDGVKPLYTDFVRRVTDAVLEMGKTPIVWEGFPKEGSETISKDVVVTAWESYYQLAPELLEGGFNITNSSWQPLYTVPEGVKKFLPAGRWSPEEVLDWNIYTWRNWNPKTAAYKEPIIVEPTSKVLGATFCIWENNYEGEIGAARENVIAMSEKVWSINSDMTHEELRAALDRVIPLAKKIT